MYVVKIAIVLVHVQKEVWMENRSRNKFEIGDGKGHFESADWETNGFVEEIWRETKMDCGV